MSVSMSNLFNYGKSLPEPFNTLTSKKEQQKINRNYLKNLVEKADEIDPQNDVLMEENRRERLNEMSKDIEETIDYLNECNEVELLWATEVLEDLSAYFKSKKLIDCVENNIKRCFSQDIKNQLKMTVEYMKLYNQNKNQQ